MQEETKRWHAIAMKLARHIRNTDQQTSILLWGVTAMNLLCEVQAMDPDGYESLVKAEQQQKTHL